MTNPAAAMKMLITYAISIPLAILVGYLITGPIDYGPLFIYAVIAALLLSPIFIKWHYPIMVLGLGLPMFCFFLVGRPPFWQVAVIISLGLAIIERAMNSDKRFIRAPVMTWPLLYTVAMVIITAEMTGGIGLKALGGDTGGGKKYISLFLGICMFFALTSRRIPKEKRGLYVAFFFLAASPAFISDLFPVLPSPLHYINLLFPPSSSGAEGITMGVTRLGAFAATAGCIANYLMARHGLRGIFSGQHPIRFLIFCMMLVLTMLGGFRIALVSNLVIIFLLFFMEGLHRTKMLLVFVAFGVLGFSLLVPFANKLPLTFQRALSFLPVNVSMEARMSAEGSMQWRKDIWSATWPKVPQYLLLGKGYALSAEDFRMMGRGEFVNLGASLDRGNEALAISGDYHNGPLSTLMPFGIWGAISFLWVYLSALFVLYRNWRYCDEEIKTVNALLLAMAMLGFFAFFFLFGAYSSDIGSIAKFAGFSIALNWGICSPKAQPTQLQRIKPLPRPLSVPA